MMVCFLSSALVQMILLESVIWSIAALLFPEYASMQQPEVLAALFAACTVLEHLFLQKPRNLLVTVLLNLAMAAAAAWLSSGEPYAAMFCHLAVFCLAFVFLVKREIKGLEDSTLMIQFQLLAVSAAWLLWLCGQLDMECPWLPWTLGGMVLLAVSMLISKTAGLRSASSGKMLFPVIGAVVAAVLFLASRFADPAGKLMGTVLQYIVNLAGQILKFLIELLQHLPKGKSHALSGTIEMAEQVAGGGVIEGGVHPKIVELVMFLMGLCMAVTAVYSLAALLRFLASRTMAKRVKAKKRHVYKLHLWKEWLLQLCRTVRGHWLLLRHPNSVAAVLADLERRCSRKKSLKRRQGETVREFLCRLEHYLEDRQPEDAAVLRRLAETADFACYGKGGSLFDDWKESRIVRKLRF